MTAKVQEIIAAISALTPAEQRELREHLKRVELVDELKGKYAFLRTSSDDFIARKQDEIELEDSRFKNP
jgi:hypothetical protein